MTENTLREAIQIWQQRLHLTGLGLVETMLDGGASSACGAVAAHQSGTRIAATLAHLARRTPDQFTTELAYPWSRDDGGAGALLGVIAESAVEEPCSWPRVDAA